jgi:hypothetical protein
MYARNSRALRASHHAPPAGSVSGVSAWHQARQTLRVGFQTPSGLHHVMGPCLHQIKYEYPCLHQIKYEYPCLHQIKYEYPCLHQIKYEYPCLHQHRRSADGLFDTERRLWFSTHIWIESLLDQARRKIQVRRCRVGAYMQAAPLKHLHHQRLGGVQTLSTVCLIVFAGSASHPKLETSC